ncbi:ATP-binding protein [Streptomyces sp. NPDC014983]|uniref:ATP-binding protein n=1 Tax=Streptomyces sp. NPDC014983 TaxID=3364933 RepID=UPI0036F5B641
MTINTAEQERARRRAPGTAYELRHHNVAPASLEVSIERHPDPHTGGLSKADAVWPQRLRRLVRASLTYWRRPDLIDTAELLLTELATNALRHGCGPDISVRVLLEGPRCMIEVKDHSPARPELCHASPTDEGGRGLFLVDALAAAWGVSPDGTTTWCTLPLTEGPSEMNPAAVIAPVLHQIPMDLPADPSAAKLARIKARALLTVLGWPGDQHLAIDILHALVDNAVEHALTPGAAGQYVSACLSVTEAHELLIDVRDPFPSFPLFDEAITGQLGCGLWDATRQGAELAWFVNPDFAGKTVRAILRPERVGL